MSMPLNKSFIKELLIGIKQRMEPFDDLSLGFWKKWISALRSGKYKQGTGSLKELLLGGSEERFCCLGVAGDLLVQATVLTWTPELSIPPRFNLSDFSIGVLPMRRCVLQYNLPHEASVLSHLLICLNDNGVSFSSIADILEYLSSNNEWADSLLDNFPDLENYRVQTSLESLKETVALKSQV